MRRRKLPEEHDHHERWLISYADFITLLFGFFVVMYSISSLNEGKYRVLSDALVNAFKNTPSSEQPARLNPPPARATTPLPSNTLETELDPKFKKRTEDMREIAQDLLQVLAPLVNDNQVKITQSLRGVTVEISAAVLFAPGQASLQPESAKALAAVAHLLAQAPNQIQVEGHTDDAPINTVFYPSNWELSSARASSVVRLFSANGVAPERMVAIGYADNRPLVANADNESRARNRRVTMLIVSEAPNPATEIPLKDQAPALPPSFR